ncbi:hypothetical protein [Methylobacterium nigriterrae]|uniref:hypothetical protein n=1 Tax=Methylobacterium nigriterrae TaxID=3127512 RepID=UPI0030135C65
MPQSSYGLSQRRLRRAARLRAEIESERERLRELLEQTQTLLDRLSVEPAIGEPPPQERMANSAAAPARPFPSTHFREGY